MSSDRKDLIMVVQVIIREHFLQRLDCSSSANTRISSVDAIHITKSNVAQIICRSNIDTPLTWVFASHVLNTYT